MMSQFKHLALFFLALLMLACQTTDLLSSYLAPSPTPTRTRTPTRAAVAPPTLPAPPTSPPVAVVPTVPPEIAGTVSENARVRSAPSTGAAVVARLNKGDKIKAVGRTAASDWYEIPLPSDPNTHGWISADLVQLQGSADVLPIVQPGNVPPTPRPYPRP